MHDFRLVQQFIDQVAAVATEDRLREALGEMTVQLGFRYYALTHHVDFRSGARRAIRLHNYPSGWEEWFDTRRLGPADPVHRASHRTASGFAWTELPRLVRLDSNDHAVLAAARQYGIGDGFTVPAHVPGEAFGSCSFATDASKSARRGSFPAAQLAGAAAFEAARRMSLADHPVAAVSLTERQRECVRWMARGKSDWEISRIIGISHETVVRHLKQARERYGVERRATLAVRALFDEQISFADIVP